MADHIVLRGGIRRWRPPVARLLVAVLLALALTYAVRILGAAALAVGLFFTLSLVLFALLSIAPDLIAHARGHAWRWWWRRNGEGPFWLGTRIPRHPRPPLLPARGAQAVPPDER